VGGFTVAAARQPASYRAVRDTISALAARGATDRWIMSCAFVALGVCHMVTARGLRRPLLALGGLATALLALAPQPVHGSSDLHLGLAGVALVALAVWPLQDRGPARLGALVLICLLVWFALALRAGVAVGLAERVLTVAEALWPIIAVHLFRTTRSTGAPGATAATLTPPPDRGRSR
jgi:hypothetical membrane protein